MFGEGFLFRFYWSHKAPKNAGAHNGTGSHTHTSVRAHTTAFCRNPLDYICGHPSLSWCLSGKKKKPSSHTCTHTASAIPNMWLSPDRLQLVPALLPLPGKGASTHVTTAIKSHSMVQRCWRRAQCDTRGRAGPLYSQDPLISPTQNNCDKVQPCATEKELHVHVSRVWRRPVPLKSRKRATQSRCTKRKKIWL